MTLAKTCIRVGLVALVALMMTVLPRQASGQLTSEQKQQALAKIEGIKKEIESGQMAFADAASGGTAAGEAPALAAAAAATAAPAAGARRAD